MGILKIKKLIFVFILIIIMNLLISCNIKKNTYDTSFFALDTMIYIKVLDYNDKNEALKFLEDCKLVIDNFENKMSKTKIDSDVSKLNMKQCKYNDIDQNVKYVIEEAIKYRDNISNVFDIYMGGLIDVWDDAKSKIILPKKEDVDRELNIINNSYEKVENIEKYVENNVAKMDLGGVAKGYIADVLAAFSKNYNIKSCIINLGGNVYVVGDKYGELFNVGIYKPFKEDEIADIVYVKDSSVVTSGIYQRYYKIENDENIYHHILNKNTGYPSNSDIISASVVCSNSMLGDMLATTCVIVGSEESKNILEKAGNYYNYDIDLILINKNNELIKYEYRKK